MKRKLHHPSRSGNKSSLVFPGSFVPAFGMWLGHHTARTACIHTQKILGSLWWKQYIDLMLHPLQSAKTMSPSRRSILPHLGFKWLLVSVGVENGLSWFWHSTYESPSFLCNSKIALHHGLWLGWIVPTSNISFTCTWTSSTIDGGILHNLPLKGSSSATLIPCLTRSVQPNSVPRKWCHGIQLVGHRQLLGFCQTMPPGQTDLVTGRSSPSNQLKSLFTGYFASHLASPMFPAQLPPGALHFQLLLD